MFYDSVFKQIYDTSPFSEEVSFLFKDRTYSAKAIFFSGTYGQEAEANYKREVTVIKQSLSIPEISFPAEIPLKQFKEVKVSIRNELYSVVDLKSNGTGLIKMELKKCR